MIKSWEDFSDLFKSFFVQYCDRILKMDDFLFRVYQYSLDIDVFKIVKIDFAQGIIYLE